MHYENFSKRLAQLRQEKGISARDMSLSLGQSESYINKIENNYAINYVYDWFGRLVLTSGDYSITAGDYDSLQLTAMDYDMIGMTAIVYDYQAYRVLHSY